MKTAEVVLTRSEVLALSDYVVTQSRHRTYRLVRDTKNVLWIRNADGKLYRLSPL